MPFPALGYFKQPCCISWFLVLSFLWEVSGQNMLHPCLPSTSVPAYKWGSKAAAHPLQPDSLRLCWCSGGWGPAAGGSGCELGLSLGGSGESLRTWEFTLEWVLAGSRDDSRIKAVNKSHPYGGDWWEAEAIIGAEAAVTHIFQERTGSGIQWLGPHSCFVLFHHRPRVASADGAVLWNCYLLMVLFCEIVISVGEQQGQLMPGQQVNVRHCFLFVKAVKAVWPSRWK